MKAQRRAANGFLPAAVLACALFADLGHAGQWSRPGLRASLSGSSGGACSAGLPDGRPSLVTGGRHRGGPPRRRRHRRNRSLHSITPGPHTV